MRREGSSVVDTTHAHNTPKEITTPKPTICGIGEKVIDKNAIAVVIDVKNIGVLSFCNADLTDTLTSFVFLVL